MAGCNPISEYWIPWAFQDPALLHLLIGCAAVYISGYSTIRDGSRGLRHLQDAIAIVNARLETGRDIMARGTIPVIAGIAMLEVSFIKPACLTISIQFGSVRTIGSRRLERRGTS